MQMMNQQMWASNMNRTLLRIPSLRVAKWCRSSSWDHLLENAVPVRHAVCRGIGGVGWRGRAFCVAAAAPVQELSDAGGKRSRRLSREERTALVESFVRRHRDTHEGEFPSTTLVIKEVGGGRQVVKDILENLQKQLDAGFSAIAAVEVNGAKKALVEVEEEEAEVVVEPAAAAVEFEEEVEVEEKVAVEESEEEESEAEEEEEEGPARAVNGTRQVGPGRGEIETQSSLNWERLRAIGSRRQKREGEKDAGVGQRKGGGSVRMSFFEGENEEDEFDVVAAAGSKASGSNGVLSPRERFDRATDTTNGVFIRYLPPSATVQDVREAFEHFGEIVRVHTVPPKRPDSKFTFGFVNFKSEDAYNKALEREQLYVRGSRVRIEPQQRETRAKAESFSGDEGGGADAAASKLERPKQGSGVGSRVPTYTVALENLPVDVSVMQVKESMSLYGQVVDAFARRGPSGVVCYVDFRTEEGRENALASRVWSPPGGQPCKIHIVDELVSPVVRLSNFATETTEDMILSFCRRFGQVEKIAVRREGVVDVFFHDREVKQLPKILASLNGVTVRQRRWRARPAPRLPASGAAIVTKEWIKTNQLKVLASIEEALKKVVVDIEDARELLTADGLPPPPHHHHPTSDNPRGFSQTRTKDGNLNLFRKFNSSES